MDTNQSNPLHIAKSEPKAENEKPSYKITDEQFLEALHFNYGIYAQTARYIKEKYGISYSRQAVHHRALKFLNDVFEYREEAKDLAEANLYEMLGQKEDLNLRYRASIYVLSCFDAMKR